jgi:hypothetical protein
MRLLLFLALAVGLVAAPSLRTLPEGTRLANGMVTPIYVERLVPAGEGTVLRLRLKDATGYRLDLFARRAVAFDFDGEGEQALALFLHQPPGQQGSTPVEVRSAEERTLLRALEVGLEHYSPGWTQNWSMEGHRELRTLILDLEARQRARE